MPRRRSAKRSTHRRTAKRSVRRSAKRSTRRRSARRSACRGWKWPWAFGEMPERYQVGLPPSNAPSRPRPEGGFFVRGQDGKKENKLIKPISSYKKVNQTPSWVQGRRRGILGWRS